MYYLYEAYSYWGESYTENDVCDYLDTSPRWGVWPSSTNIGSQPVCFWQLFRPLHCCADIRVWEQGNA
jgi:hypothetical protein